MKSIILGVCCNDLTSCIVDSNITNQNVTIISNMPNTQFYITNDKLQLEEYIKPQTQKPWDRKHMSKRSFKKK